MGQVKLRHNGMSRILSATKRLLDKKPKKAAAGGMVDRRLTAGALGFATRVFCAKLGSGAGCPGF